MDPVGTGAFAMTEDRDHLAPIVQQLLSGKFWLRVTGGLPWASVLAPPRAYLHTTPASIWGCSRSGCPPRHRCCRYDGEGHTARAYPLSFAFRFFRAVLSGPAYPHMFLSRRLGPEASDATVAPDRTSVRANASAQVAPNSP